MMKAFDALKSKPMWVAWNTEDGRKVPKSPFGGNAKVSDPATWGTYEQASSIAAANGYAGVGLLITDGLVGIDIDHAIVDGVISADALAIVNEIGSYAEISPSKTGVHVIAYADSNTIGSIGRLTPEFEIYNYGRYFTATGNAINSFPIVDATENISNFITKRIQSRTDDALIRQSIADRARDLTRRKANETVRKTAEKNGMKWARVNSPTCKCGFCLMLASRGFVYRSEKTAGGLNPSHYHSACKCTVVPGYDDSTVEGYDSDMLYSEYYRPVYERLGKYEGLCDSFDSIPQAQRDKYVLDYAHKFDMAPTTNKNSATYGAARQHWATYQVSKGVTEAYQG